MDSEGLPYKIVDVTREKKFGVVAKSLQDLVNRACEKLNLTGPIKVLLELDGTEVDEEEYFCTLDKNTTIMLVSPDQNWAPPGRKRPADETDASGRGLEGLLSRLQSDIGHVSVLGGCELELLSDMDPDSLTDIVPDKVFLDQIKEASGRILSDKRQAQEAMDLLKMYHNNQTIKETKKGTLAQ